MHFFVKNFINLNERLIGTLEKHEFINCYVIILLLIIITYVYRFRVLLGFG